MRTAREERVKRETRRDPMAIVDCFVGKRMKWKMSVRRSPEGGVVVERKDEAGLSVATTLYEVVTPGPQ